MILQNACVSWYEIIHITNKISYYAVTSTLVYFMSDLQVICVQCWSNIYTQKNHRHKTRITAEKPSGVLTTWYVLFNLLSCDRRSKLNHTHSCGFSVFGKTTETEVLLPHISLILIWDETARKGGIWSPNWQPTNATCPLITGDSTAHGLINLGWNALSPCFKLPPWFIRILANSCICVEFPTDLRETPSTV